MKNKQEKCGYCRRKAEYRVEVIEWDDQEKEYSQHPNVEYLCLKHFEEFGAQPTGRV